MTTSVPATTISVERTTVAPTTTISGGAVIPPPSSIAPPERTCPDTWDGPVRWDVLDVLTRAGLSSQDIVNLAMAHCRGEI